MNSTRVALRASLPLWLAHSVLFHVEAKAEAEVVRAPRAFVGHAGFYRIQPEARLVMDVNGRLEVENRSQRSVFQRITNQSTDFVNRKWFLKDLPGSKQFGHAQKVPIPGGAGHGDNLRIEKFACEFERDFHAIAGWHENISNDEIGR